FPRPPIGAARLDPAAQLLDPPQGPAAQPDRGGDVPGGVVAPPARFRPAAQRAGHAGGGQQGRARPRRGRRGGHSRGGTRGSPLQFHWRHGFPSGARTNRTLMQCLCSSSRRATASSRRSPVRWAAIRMATSTGGSAVSSCSRGGEGVFMGRTSSTLSPFVRHSGPTTAESGGSKMKKGGFPRGKPPFFFWIFLAGVRNRPLFVPHPSLFGRFFLW